jgi:hypothetical protein
MTMDLSESLQYIEAQCVTAQGKVRAHPAEALTNLANIKLTVTGLIAEYPPVPAVALPTPTALGSAWTPAWSDEFDAATINTKNWNTCDGWTNQNGITCSTANISITNGILALAHPTATTGAKIISSYLLQVGQVVEARIFVSGDWDAFWTAGPGWPASGEIDAFEVLGSGPSVNYHGQNVDGSEYTSNGLPQSSSWLNAWLTVTVQREAAQANVWWDQQLIRTIVTRDNRGGENIILNTGSGTVLGPMLVDYVRVWSPAV